LKTKLDKKKNTSLLMLSLSNLLAAFILRMLSVLVSREV